MPIVRYSNELVRLNQVNNFQQAVTAPTITATSINGAVNSSSVLASTISVSGFSALGSQSVGRPEEFTEISQVIEYLDGIKQALVNMGVMS